jgi:hypothetical protein
MSILKFFDSPFMFSLAMLLLSISNLALIYAFHRLVKSIDVLRLCIISDRKIVQLLMDSDSLKLATPSNKTCQ